jgi:hypothetical protein
MTTYKWQTGVSGDWSITGDWTPAGTPNAATDDAVIAAGGTYAVSIGAGESFTVGGVTLDAAAATLSVASGGTLILAGTAAVIVNQGTFQLDGLLQGGTIESAGGTAQFGGNATLNGVTWLGQMTIASESILNIAGGLRVKTAAGLSPGTIDVSTGTAWVQVLDSETLDAAVLNVGSGDQTDQFGIGNVAASGQTLTLGSGLDVTDAGATLLLGFTASSNVEDTGDTLINAGTITASGGSVIVGYGTFINSGSIAMSDNASLGLGAATLTNTGQITINSGSDLIVYTVASNTGGITVNSGGLLDVSHTETLVGGALPGLGNVTNNGGVIGFGILDLNGGTLDVTPTGLFSYMFASTVEHGTVKLDGGTIDQRGGTLDDTTLLGTLKLGRASSLSIVNGMTIKPVQSGVPGGIDMSAGDGQIQVLDRETLDNGVLNFGSLGGNAIVNVTNGSTLTLGSGFTIEQSGGLNGLQNGFANALNPNDTIINAGEIDATGGTIDAHGVGVLINSGTMILQNASLVTEATGPTELIDSGVLIFRNASLAIPQTITATGTLFGSGQDVGGITNDAGLVEANGGLLTLGGPVQGNGKLQIDPGATLKLAPGDSTDIDFTGSNETLVTSGQLSSLTGTIQGFGTGNTIDLPNVAFDSAGTVVWNDNVLTLTENGKNSTLNLSGNYTGDAFALSKDSGTGTLITEETPVCFLAGTLISTPAGEREVERLAVGDRVLTAAGVSRPITWIGKGRILATRGRRDAATPVIVRKAALADNVPHNDLRVTKAHALCIDDVLIPVEFLINHRSILWDDQAQEVELYHIELETHDVLLANGAAAESYRDDGNRWLFQNGYSGSHLSPQPACRPVLTGGPTVDSIWRQLLERSGRRGLPPLTDDPDLYLAIDGRSIDAVVKDGQHYVFQLPNRPSHVRIVSRDAVPAELGLSRDPRSLGVSLRRIAMRCRSKFVLIEASDRRLVEGFHDYEPAGNMRWTTGDALLPGQLFPAFNGAVELVLQLSGSTSYPLFSDRSDMSAA